MKGIDLHPPANLRCQIYTTGQDESTDRHVYRCLNSGTHWERWGVCTCDGAPAEFCEENTLSWECDGPHIPEAAVA